MVLCGISFGQSQQLLCSPPPCLFLFASVGNAEDFEHLLGPGLPENISLVTKEGPNFVVLAPGVDLVRLVATIRTRDGPDDEILQSPDDDIVAIDGVTTTVLSSSLTEKRVQLEITDESLLQGLVYVGSQDLLNSTSFQTREISMSIVDSTGNSSNDQLARITIANVNEGKPSFGSPSYTFSIGEDANIGDSVGFVEASDTDGVTYILNHDSFNIDSNTGEITVANNSRFDREVSTNPGLYSFFVTAQDNHPTSVMSESVRVEISITNINDNPPEFVNDTFQFTVVEVVSLGYVVGVLSAIDPDNLISSGFVFQIKSPPSPPDEFQVDTDGSILVQSNLDYETSSYFEFEVEVSEPHSSARTSANVQITVINVDDIRPMIQPLSSSKAYIDLTVIPPENGTLLNPRFEIIDDSEYLVNGFAYLNRTTVSLTVYVIIIIINVQQHVSFQKFVVCERVRY